MSKTELYQRAAGQDIAVRSKMNRGRTAAGSPIRSIGGVVAFPTKGRQGERRSAPLFL
ncbi:hypothetical protein ABZY10_39045 [Streptomyces sp. NPDC006539]|uniref:hypothetical protein n=1 Tax=unclassified Streptomyces TaxID=2593676 RepID=UPI0033B4F554